MHESHWFKAAFSFPILLDMCTTGHQVSATIQHTILKLGVVVGMPQ